VAGNYINFTLMWSALHQSRFAIHIVILIGVSAPAQMSKRRVCFCLDADHVADAFGEVETLLLPLLLGLASDRWPRPRGRASDGGQGCLRISHAAEQAWAPWRARV